VAPTATAPAQSPPGTPAARAGLVKASLWTSTLTSAAKVAQGTSNAPAEPPISLTEIQRRQSFLEDTSILALAAPAPNDLILGGRTFSGVFIQAIKAEHPLQLLNPAAPPQYGSGWDNLEAFPASVSSPGIRLFSLRF